MKTGIEMATDGFTLINVDVVNSLITGACYLLERPQNSDKIDVVVNTLALTAAQLQNGVFNVNIHCPNLKGVVIGGENDDTQPDVVSMTSIGKVVTEILKDYNGFDFKLDVQTPGMPIRDTDGNWYVNIRVNYYSFQQNYTNI